MPAITAKHRSTPRSLALGGLLLALGVLFPQVFHLLGANQAGSTLLPMHIPVLLAGMVLGPYLGTVIGALMPLLSFLLFPPMPPAARLPFMMIELAAYGLLAGLFFRRLHIPVFFSLLLAQLGGRLLYGISMVVAGNLLHIETAGLLIYWHSIVTGIPGFLLQLVLIPLLMTLLRKRGILYD